MYNSNNSTCISCQRLFRESNVKKPNWVKIYLSSRSRNARPSSRKSKAQRRETENACTVCSTPKPAHAKNRYTRSKVRSSARCIWRKEKCGDTWTTLGRLRPKRLLLTDRKLIRRMIERIENVIFKNTGKMAGIGWSIAMKKIQCAAKHVASTRATIKTEPDH